MRDMDGYVLCTASEPTAEEILRDTFERIEIPIACPLRQRVQGTWKIYELCALTRGGARKN